MAYLTQTQMVQVLQLLGRHIESRQEAALANAELCRSPDYAYGFIEGLADYVYAGGMGEPPPVPPRDYWKASYQTPAGRVAIEQWFAGFRHGVAVCHE